jgi:hypothetical protein
MNEILHNGFDKLRAADPRAFEAIMRLEAAVVRLQNTAVDDLGPSESLMGPYPTDRAIRNGSAVWVVSGRLLPGYNEGAWMGGHAVGIAVNVAQQLGYVQTVGVVEAECTEASASVRLSPGTAMFLSGSKGRISGGWPKSGKHVYQIGHVIGDHSTHRVKIMLAPMALMRFG